MRREALAIIGIGCRFPGAVNSAEQYWDLLSRGGDAIEEVPSDRWSLNSHYSSNPLAPGKMNTRWGGFVRPLSGFDARFFGITPREARRIDPQQRWLLEVALEALEDSGTAIESIRAQPVGVFIGISSNDYATLQTGGRSLVDLHTNSGSALSIAANRISYHFNLRGPSIAVDTACSSSLVAIDLACKSIWSGESSIAIAGGVNALLAPDLTIGFSKAGMLSPSGRCYAFDRRADGYVRAEGAGLVILKPLSQALADGDTPYALIATSVVNQDGRTNAMTVPSCAAQTRMMQAAYAGCGIAPGEVDYVEAHGTGTPVGDPIEAQAIGQVLGQDRTLEEKCWIGSAKTNLGHLESASGVAGLIKAALILKHRCVAPNFDFRYPNPQIDFETLRLRVATTMQPLPKGKRLVAAVNSFGFGGTNAHIVLQQAEAVVTRGATSEIGSRPTSYLLPISARTPTALQRYAEQLREQLTQLQRAEDLCYSAANRRSHYEYRAAIVGKSREDLIEQLNNLSKNIRVSNSQERAAVFLFTGQGAQWWKMGRELLNSEPVFRESVQQIDQEFAAIAGWSILNELLVDQPFSRIHQTAVAQPALFALQVGLVELYRAYGIVPSSVIGHSVGELAAAYTAGLYSLGDALTILFHRSRLQQRTHGSGKMVAIGIDAETAAQAISLYGGRVEIAALNGPKLLTLSGDESAIETLTAQFEAQRKFVRRLDVDYAFHSFKMDPLEDELLDSLRGCSARDPSMPMYSTVWAKEMAQSDCTPQYWWSNLRKPVLFYQAVQVALYAGATTFLEIGPHPVLGGMLRGFLDHDDVCITAALTREKGEVESFYQSLGAHYARGACLKWDQLYPKRAHNFVALPRYPWEHQNFWVESQESVQRRFSEPLHPLLGQRVEAPTMAWRSHISVREFNFLQDHRVQNSLVFPGTAFVELALAAAQQVEPSQTYSLCDFKFLQGLFLSEEQEVELYCTLNPESHLFEIHSKNPGAPTWTLHASATIETVHAQRTFSDLAQTEAHALISQQLLYASFESAGYEYGPAFKVVKQIKTFGDDRAIGKVEAACETSTDKYVFHPTLLDGCLQCLQALNLSNTSELFIPTSIGRVSLVGAPTKIMWSSLRLIERCAASVEVDLELLDENFLPVATIEAFRCKSLGAVRVDQQASLYVDQAIELPLAATPTRPDLQAACFIVLATTGELGTWLSDTISSLGGSCVVVHSNDELLTQLTSNQRVFAGIIDLRMIEPFAEEFFDQSLNSANTEVVLNMRNLSRLSAAPRLWIVTKNIQASISGLKASQLWGLGRVLQNEAPSMGCTLIDIDRIDIQFWTLLVNELYSGTDPEVLFRNGDRFVQRVKQTSLEHFAIRPSLEVVPFVLEIPRPGSLEQLRLRETERKHVAPREVEIEVLSVGLNFRDVMKALGLYPGALSELELFGDECCGRIVCVGAEVTDYTVGQEVIAVGAGSLRSHLTISCESIFPKPKALSLEQAATIPVAFLTAAYALEHVAAIAAHERILIHSAAGGVGLAAVQIAQARGLEIFATAGSEQKREYLRALGIKHIMDSRTLSFADQIRQITDGAGVDVVLNSLAGESMSKSLALLAPNGRFVEIGKRNLYDGSSLSLAAFKQGISFSTIDLGKLMRERPQVLRSIFDDLIARFENASLKPLPVTNFSVNEIAKPFRFMAQAKQIGKIAISLQADQPLQIKRKTIFQSDRSYLLVGGLGGFGLEVAKWMVENGAKHLILAGRNGAASLEALEKINQIRASGINLLVENADVTKAADVTRVMSKIEQSCPRLAGIMHTAMVFEAGYVAELTLERFHDVIDPKALGAWNLHQASLKLPLDFFVLFSSAAAILGGIGQASYAAANAALDALAHYRHSIGLPALSVNWGAIADVGYVSRSEDAKRYFKLSGVNSIPPAVALSKLGALLERQVTQVSVLSCDWAKLSQSLSGIRSTKFCEVLNHSASSAYADGVPGALKREILESPVASRQRLVLSYLAHQITKVSGGIEDIDPTSSLTNLGIDSLMVFQLKLEVDRDLGVEIDPARFFQIRDLNELAQALLAALETTLLNDTTSDTADIPQDTIEPLAAAV